MTYMQRMAALAVLDHRISLMEYQIEDTKREIRSTRGLDRVLLRKHLMGQLAELARCRKAATALRG